MEGDWDWGWLPGCFGVSILGCTPFAHRPHVPSIVPLCRRQDRPLVGNFIALLVRL